MTNRVPNTPSLPTSIGHPTANNLANWGGALIRALFQTLAEYAIRLNASMQIDGTERMTHPLPLYSVAAASLPDATLWEGTVLYVSDEGALAYSDGADWLRVVGV